MATGLPIYGHLGALGVARSVNPLVGFPTSFWSLAEATGDPRLDVFGTNTLTNNNGVSQVAGKIGNASHFVPGSSQSLSITDNASLACGGSVSFTAWAWAKVDETSITRTVISQVNSSYVGGFILDLNTAGNGARFIVINAAGALVTLLFGTGPHIGTYDLLIGSYDGAGNTLYASFNGGALTSTPGPAGGMADSAALFEIGGRADASTNKFSGDIDSAGFASGKVITQTQVGALWNSSNGWEP